MKFTKFVLVFAITFGAGNALACQPEQDGCMGCDDEQLQACLTKMVKDICESGGRLESCDKLRVYDDVERHVLISTGNHMSHIRSLHRSARKYQRR